MEGILLAWFDPLHAQLEASMAENIFKVILTDWLLLSSDGSGLFQDGPAPIHSARELIK